MARVIKSLQKITGTIQNATFYTIMGGDTVYLRTKGGPSKSMIKRSARFAKVRLNNSEWAGCAKMGSNMRSALGGTKELADFPVIGSMNAIAKKIQNTTVGEEHGKRGLYLSKNKDLLLGFNVSRKQVFESVVRVPMKTSINRETASAQIIIPSINTEMYLYNFRNLPFFRFFVSMHPVSDLIYSEENKKYVEKYTHFTYYGDGKKSDWFPSNGQIPEQTFDLQADLPNFTNQDLPVPECITLVLAIGLEFGKVGTDGKPTPVKYAGCGKVFQIG
jgi:hypothetical protein